MKRKAINYRNYFFSKEIQNYGRSICELTKECWDRGLSDSTGFSISQRIPNTNFILVDKSGTGFRRNKINSNDLLLIDLDGNLLFQPNAANPRLAPVNVVIHLAGYKSSDALGCIHWHDPFTNSFACYNRPIYPLTLQSKLIGDVLCINIDDRKEKKIMKKNKFCINVPSGLYARPDVYFVMDKVGIEVGKILSRRNEEFQRHGIAITHFEHGLFVFGRSVEEAFENGYRTFRNAQTIIYSQMLKNYPDKKMLGNSGNGDLALNY